MRLHESLANIMKLKVKFQIQSRFYVGSMQWSAKGLWGCDGLVHPALGIQRVSFLFKSV